MGEYTLKNNEQIPQKRPSHKSHGWLIALIVSLVIVILLPLAVVGAAFACFYDPSHKDVDYYKDATTETIISLNIEIL